MTGPAFALYSSAELAVETRGVHVRFGSRTPLGGLDLAVPTGAAYALVGAEGAGKTTALRTVLGLVRADEGTVHVLGEPMPECGRGVRARVGYVADRTPPGLLGLRVRELLSHQAAYFPAWDTAYATRCLDRLGVPADARMRDLSDGRRTLAQLAAALAHRPALLVWDEPTAALDPVARAQAFELLIEHVSESEVTLLLATHAVYEAARLVDHVGVLRAGRLRAQLPVDDLRERLRVYRFEAPDRWPGAPVPAGAVVARQEAGREQRWTIWGDPPELQRLLESAGAVVREIGTVGLDEAVLALLSGAEDR
ncbi:MAG TPA: ABC transporter ATP-binding protein [Longimicrobium sp.]|jgi:ABC-2 type transport system ATP-binding protein